jgi:hypothetical protein
MQKFKDNNELLKIELAKMKEGSAPVPADSNKLLSMMFGCLKRAVVTVKTISEGIEKQTE